MFFNSTPDFLYPDFKTPGKFKLSKNLFRRVRARDSFNAVYASSKPYTIQNGETVDSIAEVQLGSGEWYWTILILNNITNIHNQWPLDNDELDKFVIKKYGDFVDSPKYWETNEVKNAAGEVVLESGNIVEYYNNTTEQNQSNYVPQVYVTTPPLITRKVNVDSIVTGNKYTITFLGDTDFTSIGADSNTIGLEFTATGVGTGTGVVSETVEDNDPGAIKKIKKESWSFSYIDKFKDDGKPEYKTVTATQNLTKVTNREFEYQINELKREIYIPQTAFLSILREELKTLLKYETKYKVNQFGQRISEDV